MVTKYRNWQCPPQLNQATLEKIMADLTRIEAAVAKNTEVEQSVVTLLTSLAQQIRDAGTDPAKLADLATSLETNNQALADAVVANTPTPPAPAPAPAP